MDTIGDFIIRAKNSSFAGKRVFLAPYTRINYEIGKILQEEKIFDEVEVVEEDKKKKLSVKLATNNRKISRIDVKRISKPGRRVYLKAKDLKKLRGLWISIISTPQGLMNARQAIKKNLGGEILCKVIKD